MVNGRMSACLREANVKARKVTTMLAAAGLAFSPVASNAAIRTLRKGKEEIRFPKGGHMRCDSPAKAPPS